MKAARISGEAGGPGIFAVSDGVKAWDAVVSKLEQITYIDIERSDAFVLSPFWEQSLVRIWVFRQMLVESVCADYRRKAISG